MPDVETLHQRFRPAVRMLIAAGTRGGDRGHAIRRIELADHEWAALPAEAHRHGLTGVLGAIVSTRDDVPDSIREAIAALARRHAIDALRGASELVAIVEALQVEGIGAVALKGPAFSQWLYGDPAFRRFADLDVLVAPGTLDAAVRTMNARGYALPIGMSARTARAIYGGLGAWPLTGGGTYPVDLHWRLSHIRFGAALDPRAVLERSLVIRIAGRAVSIPGATDAAVLTLLHAAKHLWCTLEMLLAIAQVLDRPDVDWHSVRRSTGKAHAWQGCLVGLRLASELFAVDLPDGLRDDEDPAMASMLRDRAVEALQMPEGRFHDRWAEREAHRAAFDNWTGRVRYDVWRLIAPTPLEWQWCPLPDLLTPLYVPLRLVRLGAAAVGLPHRKSGAM